MLFCPSNKTPFTFPPNSAEMDSSSDDHGFNNSATVEITGKIMVVAIIVLFLVVVFVLFLHLYAKWFWWRIEQPPPPPSHRRRRRRSRFVFAPGQDPSFTLRTGLDAAVLKSIPVVVFNPEEFKEGLECAVCLCELEQGEKARLLPKCNHGFHVECVDMWFQSHSTCPLCRNPVDVQQGSSMEAVETVEVIGSQESLVSTESPNFPTNVLFWGNENQVSSGGACLEEGPSSSSTSTSSASTTVVIDIEDGCVEEEEKSPMPPTRLRSFKRLLSREKKVNPASTSSCSGGSFDDEQVRRV